MLTRGRAPFRAVISVAALSCTGAWLGCNELFNITAPVLEMPDGGQEAGSGAGGSDAGGADAGDAGPVEDCLNGDDDDGDGFVDCQDPECQIDYGCAVDPEAGWSGLVYMQAITYNPHGAPPLPCPDAKLPAIYYAAPSAAECTGCSCTLSDATCTAPTVAKYHVGTCDGMPPEGSIQPATTNCTTMQIDDVGGILKITAPAMVVDRGTCTPDGGALINPDPWGQEVRVCAAQAGKGCSAGKSCVKKAPSGFQALVCITQAGTAACPSGWTDQSLQLHAGGMDDRTCSSCTCDTSTVTCSGGKYTVNATSDCSVAPGTTPLSVSAADGCVTITNLARMNSYNISLKPELGTPGGLTCGTSTPSGSVTTTGDTRICCRQMIP